MPCNSRQEGHVQKPQKRNHLRSSANFLDLPCHSSLYRDNRYVNKIFIQRKEKASKLFPHFDLNLS